MTGAARYELWAWLGSWTQIDGGALTATSYVHDGLTVGRTYYFQGRAVTSAGVMSAWSAQVSATVLSAPNIGAPSLTATRGNGQVTLTWSAPSNLAGQTIASYDYRYAASGSTLGAWTDAGNDGTKTISGLTNGTAYDFELRAVSDTGAEGASDSDSATPATLPGAPTLSATAAYRSIVLTWTAPADNGGSAVTRYKIQRLDDDNQWITRTSNVPGTTTTWTDRSLSDSKTYHYRIFAKNDVGDSADWGSASALTLANPVEKSGSPTSLSATAGPAKIDLTWQAPVFNGGAAVTEYRYRHQKDKSSSWFGWQSSGTDLKAEITGLDPGVDYKFQVVAVNSAGVSDPAETIAAPDATAPTAAPSLTIVLARDSSGGSDNREQVRIEYRNIKDSADGGA